VLTKLRAHLTYANVMVTLMAFATIGSDLACVGGDGSTHFPGALVRGGAYNGSAAYAGPFAVTAVNQPSVSSNLIGFRGAR
jgi:hypothetical protein